MHTIIDPRAKAVLRDFDGLTPLAAAKAAFLQVVRPVPPTRHPLEAALGRVLAEAVSASNAHPPCRVALYDGYAVASRDTVGATPYAPTYSPHRLDPIHAGAALDEGYDAVLPPDAVTFGALGSEVLQAVCPGAGTREAGEDLAQGAMIATAGTRLRPEHIAVLAFAGIETVALRIPRFSIEGSGPAVRMISDLAAGAGCDIDETGEPDITICLCGPGYAASAEAVSRCAEDGMLMIHGLAVRPGTAIGLCGRTRADGTPRLVIVVPERLEDLMAAWLLFIQPALTLLADATGEPRSETLPLSGKIVSAAGMADLVLLRRTKLQIPQWEPTATGNLTWAAFAAADAYCLVAPEREGFPAGTLVVGTAL